MKANQSRIFNGGGLVLAAFISLMASASAQQQLLQLLPPGDLPGDPAAGDHFGIDVAISGNRIVVGASYDDDDGDGSGTAYLFDASTGQRLHELRPSDGAAGDYFGEAVAISGDRVVIGARHDDDLGASSGSAYVFDAMTGQQLIKLLPSDGGALDMFGMTVALSGNIAVIGAAGDGVCGSAYVFDVSSGQELVKLLPSDGAQGDRFAWGLDIDDSLAIVGAYFDDDNGQNSGSAYVFDARTGQQLRKLVASDGAPHEYFGFGVGISDDRALVGAFFDDDNGLYSGSAYVFDVVTGQQLAKLLPPEGREGDEFGKRVSISGNRALVGSEYHDGGGPDKGAAFLFDADTGQPLYTLLHSPGSGSDQFGSSVEIRGNRAVIGAEYEDAVASNSGAAYLFEVADGLLVTPAGPFEAKGNIGGPFHPGAIEYTLHNTGSYGFDYETTVNRTWLAVSNGSGFLTSGEAAVVRIEIDPAAGSLGLGLRSGQVSFQNTTTHEGDTELQVTLEIGEGLPERLHAFPLDSDPGWTCQAQWEFGTPTGDGGEELYYPDPQSGHTGANVYGYNLYGDYANDLPTFYRLTTTAVDCSGSTGTTLKFWRWLNVERSYHDHARLYVSNDGAGFVNIWKNPVDVGVESWRWEEVEYDLSSVADGESSVYLRWSMGPTDSVYPASGWNIDDVEIWGVTPRPGSAFCSGESGSGTACPCNNAADGSLPGAGCANGVFYSGAYLTATGTASVTGDTLVLRTTHAEPSNSGLYFQGTTDLTPGMIWGDGLRCTGGGIVRLQVRFADPEGSSHTTIPIGAAGGVSAGDARYYQLWYRTIDDPPCGTGVNDFNSSNGYAITWLP